MTGLQDTTSNYRISHGRFQCYYKTITLLLSKSEIHPMRFSQNYFSNAKWTYILSLLFAISTCKSFKGCIVSLQWKSLALSPREISVHIEMFTFLGSYSLSAVRISCQLPLIRWYPPFKRIIRQMRFTVYGLCITAFREKSSCIK